MRVLVCGGRDYANWRCVYRTLHALHASRKISCIIEGGARGADRMGRRWATLMSIQCETYLAFWDTVGPQAGTERNQRMLDEGKPALVVAFPGGAGTADLIKRARAKKIRVRVVDDVDA